MNALKRLGSAVINMLDSGPDILLRTDAPLSMPDRKMLAEFAERAGIPRIAWEGKGGPAEVAAQVKPEVRHNLSGITVSPPPGAFLQASAAGRAAIIAAVMAGLPEDVAPRAHCRSLCRHRHPLLPHRRAPSGPRL